MQKIIHFFSGALLLMAGFSCTKVKTDVQTNNVNVLTTNNSSIRLFNFSTGNLNLAVNNVQLTNFDAVNSTTSTTVGTEIGLKYFPTGVWKGGNDGAPFTIPNTLLTRQGQARILVVPGKAYTTGSTQEFSGQVNLDTTLTDDPLHPKDYYIVSQSNVIAVPRTTEVPVQPDHFKIRVLNFAGKDSVKNAGPVTLTWANGNTVDPAVTNVGPGQASPYVELPYGTDQFKIFVNGNYNKQLPEYPIHPSYNACLNLPGANQQGFESLIRTFKPGGTYAIVITPTIYAFGGCTPDATVYASANAYRIITEIAPPLNTSYARLQCVNTLPAKTIALKIDGAAITNALPYTSSTDYTTVIATTHTVQAYDDKGALLVQKDYSFAASDNITAWVYENAGKPDIVFMQNRMSFYHYLSNLADTSDGTDGSIHTASYNYAWQSRFLNLTADIPYVTFSNDGQPFYIKLPNPNTTFDTLNLPGSYQHLAPGAASIHDPYVIIPYGIGIPPTSVFNLVPVIRVHRSDQTIPGPLLGDIPALRFNGFIANPGMYLPGNLPQSETGIYTVALIGRGDLNAPAAEQEKLLIIKHNQ